MRRVDLVTFGHDHGDPPSADKVYDVRGERYSPERWDAKAEDIARDAKDGECIAIGCKHGHTRSVEIASRVQSKVGKGATVRHLDKDKAEETDMSLMHGSSRETIDENVREMVKAGHSEKEAIAAAHRMASKGRTKKKRGMKGKMPMSMRQKE